MRQEERRERERERERKELGIHDKLVHVTLLRLFI